ncbi:MULTISPECIES: RNA-guided endonuclease InsQ/TnpB family protein [Crocosphaera]|uniref:Transposase n=4 Tax=Crocosphaera watsonii TaxID=263511 RepID=T2IR40_CROWT|nr:MULTISPECIES: RNA-guided endonuclease TnpB family protein [Crocosphaera]MCH2245050.1 transposase [Crocosphaera sp.]CCQ56021.1 Transposase [Crocosphaera watsonii WH 0005]
MLNLNYCYRIYPDASQEKELLDWLEICRCVYNYALRERKEWINSRKCKVNACSLHSEYIIPADQPFPDYYKQKKALTQAKKEYPSLKRVQSQVLQEVIGRLDKAFNFFWKRSFGFPRFKKYGQYRSINFPQFKDNPITGYQIRLPKIGSVRLNLHRPIPDGFIVKQVQIVKKASGWYAVICIQSDVKIPSIEAQGKSLGIDLGLEKFIATSQQELIVRPRFFVELQSKLQWLQRRLSKKQKGSKNWHKAREKVARLHEHIYNTRKNFHYQVAHHLCDQANIIFAEDLNLKAMSRGMLCKHTLDAGFGSFLEILSHVAWKRNVYFEKVDANFTSQTCPNCGVVTGKKSLSQRVHECSNCGFVTDRDVAAAMIVEQRGLAALGLGVKLPVEDEVIGDVRKKSSRASRRSRKAS